MTPELKFYTSTFYEGQLTKQTTNKSNKLSREEFVELVTQIKQRKNQLQHYLNEITQMLQVTWERKEIEVWLVNRYNVSFSHPLTIAVMNPSRVRDMEEIIDVIIHELIHVALPLHPQYAHALEELKKDYPTATKTTQIHIIVHAILAIYFQKLRGNHRMSMDIQYLENYPEYKQAWDIVLEKGPEKILEKYLGINQ